MAMKKLPDARDLDLLRTRMSTQFQIPSAYDDALSYQGLIYKLIQYLKDTMQNVEDWNVWLEDFVATFDENLGGTVRGTIQGWIDDGTIQVIISEALQWELDDYKITNEQDKTDIKNEIVESRGGRPELADRLNEIDVGLNIVSEQGLKVLFVSDIHNNTQTYGGLNAFQRMTFLVECINEEHEIAPIDMVFVTGDLSSNSSFYTLQVINNFLPRLHCPYYVLNGNHDNVTDEAWFEALGYEKDYTVVSGNYGFICINNFKGEFANDGSGYGNAYTTSDIAWVNEQIAKLNGRKIIIVTHYFNHDLDTELADVIDNNPDILCVFQGHTHLDDVTQFGVNQKYIFNCGSFSIDLNNEFTNGWRYKTLENENGELVAKTIYVPRVYPTFTNTYEVRQTTTITVDENAVVSDRVVNSKESLRFLNKRLAKTVINTSGIEQHPDAGIMFVHSDPDYHVDNLYHSGMYYVNDANGSPVTGFMLVMGYSANNFVQVLVPISTTVNYIQIRQKSGGVMGAWKNLNTV